MEEKIIELKVGFESEYADSGIFAMKIPMSKEIISILREALEHSKKYGYFCIEIFNPTIVNYFDEEGEVIKSIDSNFRIGCEFFKVFSSGGICFTAENKHDSTLFIESEEFTIDENLNVVIYSKEV